MNWTEEQLAEHYRRLKTPQAVEPPTEEPMAERLIEAECTKFLEEDGWRALRTDPVSDRRRGKGFGELGMADHLYIRYHYHEHFAVDNFPGAGCVSEVLWVEFKARKHTAEKHQREWHQKERARGALTWIANEDFPATVDGFRDHYAASGLMRRQRWW